jgi:RNA polymerase sigma factor (sigma-70 family)
MVTDAEFRQALSDKNNKNIINSVLSHYYNIIPQDDLESCGLDALWRCLGYHQADKGNKFTTSLWKFTTWECRRKLKEIRRHTLHRVVNISTIEKDDKFDIPEPKQNPDIEHLRECINLLPFKDKQIIQEYYFDRYTMEQIGQLHNYSKEAASQKINKAVNKLRKRYKQGVL